jgi:hypothetical protein
MARETLGNGQGGKTYEDRELAKKVRQLTLKQSYKELKKGKGKLYEALLIRLAGTALPRLHAGRDDDERLIPQPLLGGESYADQGNDSDKETPETEEED